MKMRADHATSPHCDIFTIITNKHSSHTVAQLWSGPMRALVTRNSEEKKALCLHISSYECSHWSRPWLDWQQRGCVISSYSVDNRLCSWRILFNPIRCGGYRWSCFGAGGGEKHPPSKFENKWVRSTTCLTLGCPRAKSKRYVAKKVCSV